MSHPSAPPARLRDDMVWITWSGHRRTTELARALNAPLREIVFRASRPARYALGAIVTLATLVRRRPRIVFVQNPSIVLAAYVCALKRLLGHAVVVDRHSNFTFEDTDSGPFNMVSNYSLRRADLTIVTNAYVKQLVESKGGRGFVLPDKLPTLGQASPKPLPGRFNVLFVCTYSPDEPIAAVIDAARQLPEDVHVYVTGNHHKLPADVRANAPSNLRFTGFLSAEDYESLMASVDVVLELTTRDHTLLCGAYEAVSLGKPLVISKKDALTQYFRRGAVITENTPEGIAEAITRAAGQLPALQRDVMALREELERDWQITFERLKREIAGLC